MLPPCRDLAQPAALSGLMVRRPGKGNVLQSSGFDSQVRDAALAVKGYHVCNVPSHFSTGKPVTHNADCATLPWHESRITIGEMLKRTPTKSPDPFSFSARLYFGGVLLTNLRGA
jgi:hypothetical protein